MKTALAVAAMIFFVLACNEQKKINKAIQTVLNNNDATNSVGRHWERTHPCANDTTIIHKTDTTEQAIFIDADCPPSDTATKIKVETKRIFIHDTTKTVVVDRRREQLLEKDLNNCASDNMAKTAEINGLKATVKDLTKQMSDMAKRENWLIWKNRLIIGLPLILAILGFVFRDRLPFLNR